MTPDERDCLNRIERDGASSCAQLSNREHGIPSGPAAELEESSLIESIMIDSVMVISVKKIHHPDMQLIKQKRKPLDLLPVC